MPGELPQVQENKGPSCAQNILKHFPHGTAGRCFFCSLLPPFLRSARCRPSLRREQGRNERSSWPILRTSSRVGAKNGSLFSMSPSKERPGADLRSGSLRFRRLKRFCLPQLEDFVVARSTRSTAIPRRFPGRGPSGPSPSPNEEPQMSGPGSDSEMRVFRRPSKFMVPFPLHDEFRGPFLSIRPSELEGFDPAQIAGVWTLKHLRSEIQGS